MDIQSLKRSFLATLPVIGPQHNIEAELLLAGIKPIGYFDVCPENIEQTPVYFLEKYRRGELNEINNLSEDEQRRWEHKTLSRIKEIRDVKKLDSAVKNGQLISRDMRVPFPQHPSGETITRFYAQPDQKGNEFEQFIDMLTAGWLGEESSASDATEMDKDSGYYLGYRRRDIIYFSKIVQSGYLPDFATDYIYSVNQKPQEALRDTLLIRAGYDPDTWKQNFNFPNL